MRTIISLAPTCICQNCGEEFKFKRHRGPLLKILLFFADIRKYYCDKCKITYYVYLGSDLKVPGILKSNKE